MRESVANAQGRTGWRVAVLPASIAALELLAATGGQPAREWLRYERSFVLDGEYWRLVTGHIVHLGWPHTLLNLAGLALVWLLFATEFTQRAWLAILLSSMALIDAGFLLLERNLVWYVGFSGVLHGLFAAGALSRLARREPDGLLLVAALLAKLVWEQLLGPLPLTEAAAGGPVVESAHLYGAIGGALAVGVLISRRHAGRL